MKKSKTLITSMVLGIAYALYLIVYFSGAILGAESGAAAVGGGLAAMIVAPHMALITVGALFSLVAVLTYKSWAGLTAFILYYVASAVFPLYAIISLPIAIIATVGWNKMRKQVQ